MYNRNTNGKGKKILADDYAVSEILGTIILLGIVVSATAIFLLAGTRTIDSAESSATMNGVQQAFTMADSRLSKARFSTAVFQEAPFKVSGGVVNVNGSWDDSHIIVYNIGSQNVIYNGSLGTIKCFTSEGEVAYQDGGVWVRDNSGGSVMISPPDFDYNGVTLTLPVMRIDGNQTLSVSGNNDILINVNSSGTPVTIFPSVARGGNPIPQGYSINITIKSDYYQAWASYINERTKAEAVVDAQNKTVNVSLKTGIPMQQGLATNGFTTKSMDASYDAPLYVFNLDLNTRNSGNDYTITYGVVPPNTANPDFQLSVTRTKGSGNKDWAMITTFFKHGTETEKFQTEIEFERKNEEEIYLDMLNHSIMLEYSTDSTLPQTRSWGDDPGISDTSSTFMIEYDDPLCKDVSYGEEKSLYDIVQHYMRLMAAYDQAHGDAFDGPRYGVIGKDKFDESKSTFQISYASSQDIKYLYVTEGVLETTLASRG